MRIGTQQEMSQFVRHGVAKNHGRRDLGLFLQLLDGLVEQIGVASPAIFGHKRYSDRGCSQASGGSDNPQMKMRRERGFGTRTEGSFMLGILWTIQPNDSDARISKDLACLAFRPIDGRGQNRR